jgi:hypothetical protein
VHFFWESHFCHRIVEIELLLLPGPYEEWHLPSGIGVSSFEGNPDS